MAWVGYEYRDLKVGDEMIVEYRTRFNDSHQRVKVEKLTETSFWAGGHRYTRSWGRRHGDQNYRCVPFTQERWNDLENHRKAKEREAAKKNSEAEQREIDSRIEFGCDHIKDEEAQKILRELRNRVYSSQAYIQRVVETCGQTTVEKPWPLYHQMRDGDHERYITAVQQYDMCRELHHRLVETADAFEQGQSFDLKRFGTESVLSKANGTKLSFLIKHEFRALVLRRLMEFIHTSRPRVGDREVIDGLMEACGLRWGLDYSVRPIRAEEAAA